MCNDPLVVSALNGAMVILRMAKRRGVLTDESLYYPGAPCKEYSPTLESFMGSMLVNIRSPIVNEPFCQSHPQAIIDSVSSGTKEI